MRDRIVATMWVVTGLSVLTITARAETTECTVIDSVPYVITTQGVYCFKGHLATSLSNADVISINTNNVVIDMNGYKLGGLAAGPETQSVGIYAFQRKNITIRNGSVRGFQRGIWLHDNAPYDASQGHLIEGVRADGNTETGLDIRGRGNVVRNNQVVNTGGSTARSSAYGIFAAGSGVQILGNTITETVEESGELSYGIHAFAAPGAVVEENRVGNAALGDGTSHGIFVTNGSTGVSVVDNRISNFDTGVWFSGDSGGKYRDNIANGVTTPYTGGTDVGNND